MGGIFRRPCAGEHPPLPGGDDKLSLSNPPNFVASVQVLVPLYE
jgi:hypothetical protein